MAESLSYKEFAARVFAIAGQDLWVPVKEGSWFRTWDRVKSVAELTTLDARLVGERVHVGGVHGGSCWDTGESGDPHRAYSVAHAEPTLDSLDKILAEFCPNITYLQYRRLEKEANLQTEEARENEYYGNHSDYVQKYVTLHNLYEALITVGIISE